MATVQLDRQSYNMEEATDALILVMQNFWKYSFIVRSTEYSVTEVDVVLLVYLHFYESNCCEHMGAVILYSCRRWKIS